MPLETFYFIALIHFVSVKCLLSEKEKHFCGFFVSIVLQNKIVLLQNFSLVEASLLLVKYAPNFKLYEVH